MKVAPSAVTTSTHLSKFAAPSLPKFSACRPKQPRLLQQVCASSRGTVEATMQEVRSGRQLYIQQRDGNPEGHLAGQQVLFAHGANGDHSLFKEQVGLLTRAGASCISYDMLGAGRSSKPRPATPEGRLAAYSPDEHYQDLKALLDMLLKKRGHQRVVLVGYSLGAALTIRLAAEHPGRTQGVVLLGVGYSRKWAMQYSSGRSKPDHRPGPLGASLGNAAALIQRDSHWLDQLLRQAFKVLPRQPWWRELPEWLLSLLMPLVALQTIPYFFNPRTIRRRPGWVFTEWFVRARNKPWVSQATGKQIGQLTEPWERFTGWLGSIQAPSLIIDQESCYPGPELMAADMQDGQGFSIPHSEHQVHQDQPEAVNRLLLDFLQQKVCKTGQPLAGRRKEE